MQTCNFRNPDPIAIDWAAVDRLMAEHGIANDAALAARGRTYPSVISRGRRGDATVMQLRALKTAFPELPIDAWLLPAVEDAA